MTLMPSTSAAELVGIAPLEKKREETIVVLLLDKFRARKEFMVTAIGFGFFDRRLNRIEYEIFDRNNYWINSKLLNNALVGIGWNNDVAG